MFKLETPGPESKEVLLNLWEDSFIQAYRSDHTKENLQTYCKENFTEENAIAVLEQKESRCIIATDDHRPAGFYVLKHKHCPVPLDGASCELKQIYILSDYYGKGLGKLLYEDAVASATHSQSAWLWLCVSDLNTRAQSFYNKLGFTAAGPGPKLVVGTDILSSTIMTQKL